MLRIRPFIVSTMAIGVLAGASACTPAPGALDSPGGAVVMAMPMTTTSEEARTQFLEGMDAADMARALDAHDAFARSVAVDSTFAFGYLQLANFGNSLTEFTTNLQKAETHAATASRAEQLLIEIARMGFNADVEGQLRAAQELVQVQPESPRAWLALAGIQGGLNRNEESRQSINRAIELAPTMAAAHLALANSYVFGEPKDFSQAEAHANRAVELRPDEPTPYDILGDVHRAQGSLEAARTDYTMAAERAPTDASPIQQRGHVNSFLGDFDAARADYDRSMELGRANQAPNFGLYRAFVSVHAGNPEAAITELNDLTSRIDGMNIPEPTGAKVTMVFNAVQIALHHRMMAQATTLTTQLATLLRQQAEQVGTDQFRRGQEAGIAYWEGRLAAARKDFTTARAKVEAITTLLAPDANPRKMEPVHELLGVIALEEKKPAEAVTHLREGNQNTTYTRYLLATALEADGKAAEARKIFTEVANNNFNSVDFALTRAEARKKAGE